jgi:hypothetical protein
MPNSASSCFFSGYMAPLAKKDGRIPLRRLDTDAETKGTKTDRARKGRLLRGACPSTTDYELETLRFQAAFERNGSPLYRPLLSFDLLPAVSEILDQDQVAGKQRCIPTIQQARRPSFSGSRTKLWRLNSLTARRGAGSARLSEPLIPGDTLN